MAASKWMERQKQYPLLISATDFLGVNDTYGIELIPPVRNKRNPSSDPWHIQPAMDRRRIVCLAVNNLGADHHILIWRPTNANVT